MAGRAGQEGTGEGGTGILGFAESIYNFLILSFSDSDGETFVNVRFVIF